MHMWIFYILHVYLRTNGKLDSMKYPYTHKMLLDITWIEIQEKKTITHIFLEPAVS